MNGQGGRNGAGTAGGTGQTEPQDGDHRSGLQTREPARPYPHIKDLKAKAAALQVDKNTPISRLLQAANESVRQSNTLVEFKRADLAYIEHLKASEIVLTIIPSHKDYGALHDRGEWDRQYRVLLKDIDQQQAMIGEIRAMICEDNYHSGVQPTAQPTQGQPNDLRQSRPSSSSSYGIPTPSGTPPLGFPSSLRESIDGYPSSLKELESLRPPAPSSSATSTQPPRQRPAVRPKPDALHSQAVGGAGSFRQDPLVERFARLRIAQSPPSQGERTIGESSSAEVPGGKDSVRMPSPSDFVPKSQPSSRPTPGGDISRPSGPRDMPVNQNGPPHPPKIPLGLPADALLPKPPSPAYSPAYSFPPLPQHTLPRTSTENTLLGGERYPLQAAQGGGESFVRTNSPSRRVSSYHNNSISQSTDASSPQPVANGSRQFNNNRSLQDYNVYASNSATSLSSTRSTNRRTIDLPAESEISAEKLFDYIKQYHVLLIDVRSRDQFDQGHIFSKSIICIEPFSLRPGLSADELEESLVLSPESEQSLFEHRNEFDLVVFYDQSTTSTNDLSSSTFDRSTPALGALFDTLYEFNYSKELKDGRPPVLLSGGLDAWIDLVGPQSLQMSQTATAIGATRPQPLRRQPRMLGRALTVNANSSHEIRRKRLRSHIPMTESERAAWLKKTQEEEVDPSRYKHDADELEGGEAEIAQASPVAHTLDDFFRRFPEPSDIQQSMTMPSATRLPPPTTHSLLQFPEAPSRPPPTVPRPSYHGTSDPSTIQAPLSRQTSAQQRPLYFSVPQARRALPGRGLINFRVTCYLNATVQCLNATFPLTNYFLSNTWRANLQPGNGSDLNLLTRNFATVIHQLWAANAPRAFKPDTFYYYIRKQGGTEISQDRQHDAKEFLEYVLDYLHSDLNTNHKRNRLRKLTDEEERIRESMPVAMVSQKEWDRYIHRDRSIVSELFAGQHASRIRCLTCNNTSTTYETFFSLSIEIPDTRQGAHPDISACLASYFKEEVLDVDDYHCKYCKGPRKVTKKLTLTRLPQYLIIHFKRFVQRRGGFIKLHTEIEFPLYGLDMEPYMISRRSPPYDPDGNPLPIATRDLPTTPPFKYDAYGVIRHLGQQTTSGHYVALVKDAARGKWLECDDDAVSVVDIEKLKGKNRLQNNAAYIVFYERALMR